MEVRAPDQNRKKVKIGSPLPSAYAGLNAKVDILVCRASKRNAVVEKSLEFFWHTELLRKRRYAGWQLNTRSA